MKSQHQHSKTLKTTLMGTCVAALATVPSLTPWNHLVWTAVCLMVVWLTLRFVEKLTCFLSFFFFFFFLGGGGFPLCYFFYCCSCCYCCMFDFYTLLFRHFTLLWWFCRGKFCPRSLGKASCCRGTLHRCCSMPYIALVNMVRIFAAVNSYTFFFFFNFPLL